MRSTRRLGLKRKPNMFFRQIKEPVENWLKICFEKDEFGWMEKLERL